MGKRRKHDPKAIAAHSKVKGLQSLSRGPNLRKMQAIIAHYENQTDDQAVAEDEAAYRGGNVTMMRRPSWFRTIDGISDR